MKIKFYRLNIIEIFIFFFMIIFILMGLLKRFYSNYFGYTDELLMMFLILIYIGNVLINKKIKVKKETKKIILGYFTLLLIGLAGNLISKAQIDKYAIVIDFFSWLKFFGVIAIIDSLITNDNLEKYYYYLIKLCKFSIVYGFVIYILTFFNIIEFDNTVRYGVLALTIGGHPSFSCALYALCASVLICDYKKNIIWILLSVILCLLTLRSKAFGFIAMLLVLIIIFNRKLKIKNILIAGIVVLAISWKPISFYYLNSQASRAVLLNTSFKIAKDYFPFGSGFGTFGTIMSSYHYSNIYIDYGLSNRYGFSKAYSDWVGDGGFASIIGQFGYIGISIFISFFINFVKIIKLKVLSKNKKYYLPICLLIGYILISSTNESFFNSDISMLFAISIVVLSKILNIKYERENDICE